MKDNRKKSFDYAGHSKTPTGYGDLTPSVGREHPLAGFSDKEAAEPADGTGTTSGERAESKSRPGMRMGKDTFVSKKYPANIGGCKPKSFV